jgi:O-antigen ligase
MCRTWKSVRGTLFALVVSGVILARAALTGYSGGRAATETMYDTNDLAYVFVILIPIALGFAITARTNWKRVAYTSTVTCFVVAVLLTQSRGGLLGLLTVGLLLVLLPLRPPSSQGAQGVVVRNRRLTAIFVIACLGAIVWPQLPDSTRTRLETVLNLKADYNLDPHDVNGRSRIWSRGWQAVKDRPFGYGVGSYPLVDARYGGRFNTAHNSFLLVLVEAGFIGLALFIRLYFLTWRCLGRVRHDLLAYPSLSQQSRERYVFSGMLRCSIAGSAVAGFFLSMAWVTVLWIVIALCMAIAACDTEALQGATLSDQSQVA